MPLAPGEKFGSYEILALSGKGGMVDVHHHRCSALALRADHFPV